MVRKFFVWLPKMDNYASNMLCFMRLKQNRGRGGVFLARLLSEFGPATDGGLQIDDAMSSPRSSPSQSIVRWMGVIICKGAGEDRLEAFCTPLSRADTTQRTAG